MSAQKVVSLGSLESDLGLSRVDLLLIIRELGIEPVRKGMRTWIKQEETNEIYTHLGRNNPEEPLIAEIVTIDTQEQFDSLAFSRNQTTKEINDGNESFKTYSQLRLLRERIELLDLLKTTSIEVPTSDLCALLNLKRVPTLTELPNHKTGFSRMGLVFEKISTEGKRIAWKVAKET